MAHVVHETHPEIVNRLKRAEGHLRKTIAMIEAGRTCLDLAQQLHAIEKAVAAAKKTLITPPRTSRATRPRRWPS